MTGDARVTYGSTGVAARPAVIPVEESSQVGEARRAASALAESLGFDETAQGRAALVATEAATNLVKHARGGVLFVQASRVPTPTGDVPATIELIAVDRGPGMADPSAALRDGYSTSGTSGAGLGAIRRVADYFELDSHPGHGTVMLAHVAARPAAPTYAPPVDDGRLRIDIGAVCVPIAGERECGDAWAACDDDDGALAVLLADGLGHGDAAAVAAETATRTFVASATRGEADPRRLLETVHGALRPTRGAAVSVATIDRREVAVRFAGIGNVAGVIVPVAEPTATRSLVALSGIVGHQMRTLQEFVYPLPAGALLILASDGVRPLWRFESYPGLARRHPSIVAATLWRDYARGRDDASVVVARLLRSGGGTT